MTDYDTRRQKILDILHGLSNVNPADLSGGLIDQLTSANRDAEMMMQRLNVVESVIEPGRFDGTRISRDDRKYQDEFQSRVLAAMTSGHWVTCAHLRRTPAQPAHVLLPIRRISCTRCLSTRYTPPADEADRCDLCGTRNHIEFWPLRAQQSYMLIVGDVCRDCAVALEFPDMQDTAAT